MDENANSSHFTTSASSNCAVRTLFDDTLDEFVERIRKELAQERRRASEVSTAETPDARKPILSHRLPKPAARKEMRKPYHVPVSKANDKSLPQVCHVSPRPDKPISHVTSLTKFATLPQSIPRCEGAMLPYPRIFHSHPVYTNASLDVNVKETSFTSRTLPSIIPIQSPLTNHTRISPTRSVQEHAQHSAPKAAVLYQSQSLYGIDESLVDEFFDRGVSVDGEDEFVQVD